jgi:hypothetical protein
LKVRTITAGPELDYYWARYIQKFLHKSLRHIDAFRLIGKTLSLEDIHRTFWKPLSEGEFFVSGDYKSATDLISGYLSELCARAIAQASGMPEHIRDLFVRCLVRHDIILPATKTRKEEQAPQQNGQLMGSPVSFPILCLINAALTRYAKEIRDGRKYPLKELALLINGDDVGFVTDQLGYDIWKKITRMGGLQFSLGKNFTSPDFLVLNSCMFELVAHEAPRPMFSSRDRLAEGAHGGRTFAPHTERMKTTFLQDLTVPSRGRNVFRVTQWQNPDYLGPVGRYLGEVDTSTDHTSGGTGRYTKLPALRACKIARIEDLFEPEHYAVLPGLQQAWLGAARNEERCELNRIFLASWKPVLKLSEINRHGYKHAADWFLPCPLGGLGLENCNLNPISDSERKGDRQPSFRPSVEGSSSAGRRLAKFLLLNRDQRVPVLPSLSIKSPYGIDASDFVLAQRSIDIHPQAPLPAGYCEEADITAYAMRRAWMSSFGIGLESPFTASKEEVRDMLIERLGRFNWARHRLWKPVHGVVPFMELPEISQKEVDNFFNQRRVYAGSCPRTPRTDLRLEWGKEQLLARLPPSTRYFTTPDRFMEEPEDPITVYDWIPGPLGSAMRREALTGLSFLPYVGRVANCSASDPNSWETADCWRMREPKAVEC